MILAIDPGTTKSALVVYNPHDGSIADKGILENKDAEVYVAECQSRWIGEPVTTVIEMVASYGMPVGRDVFETVYWIGRFAAAWDNANPDRAAQRMYRSEVKMHLCQNTRAKDANIRQALMDRFGPGKELAVGLKATPGPLYGFKSDLWAALAVAVTYDDLRIPF